MQAKKTALAVGLVLGMSPLCAWSETTADEISKMQQAIEALQEQLKDVKAQLAAAKKHSDALDAKQANLSKQQADQQQTVASVQKKQAIHVGGAVRFNYTLKQFSQASRNTQGDLNFDTFRFNLDGEIDHVILSAEWRYYNYMQVIHHAWVGYKFTPDWTVRAGVVKVPFGNLPFNSNSYYFSSNYYVGFEDNYQLGLSTTYKLDGLKLDLAFLKNPQPNGYGNDSYSFNVIGFDDGSGGATHQLKTVNTFAGRVAYDWKPTADLSVTPGLSAMYGSLTDGSQRQGNYHAYAAHVAGSWKNWSAKLQFMKYKYDINNASARRLVYGAYAYDSYGATEANSLTGSLAYTWHVDWGPISSLSLYNDYSRIYAKNDNLPVTWMNTTGLSVGAGPIYAYFDFIQAKNQPFVGGNTAPLVGTTGGLNRLFNINIGYYF